MSGKKLVNQLSVYVEFLFSFCLWHSTTVPAEAGECSSEL